MQDSREQMKQNTKREAIGQIKAIKRIFSSLIDDIGDLTYMDETLETMHDGLADIEFKLDQYQKELTKP